MLKENDRISGGNIFEGIVSVRTLIANSLAFAAGNSGNDRKIKRVFCDSGRTGKSREYAWIKHRGEELGFDVVMRSSEDIDCMTVGNTHGGLARGMHRPHDSRDIRGHDKTERVRRHA